MKLRNPATLRDDPLLRRVWDQIGRPAGCRVTGGYVRDRLLGRPSNDLDLTIEGDAVSAARPARRLAKALGVHAHLLGTEPHRIWRVETAGLKVELWPRGDLSIERDLLRRDFGCNALSWELPNGPFVDLVGGLDDLQGLLLRAVSRANLESDPVRLLRAPRFLAQLPSFELEPRTRAWIRELGAALAAAPRERVGQELLIMLRGPAASRGVAECLRLGLLGPASPAADRVDGEWITARLDAADRLAAAHHAGGTPAGLDNCGDSARLAFLIRGWGVPSDRELAPYAWPKADREAALTAARNLEGALSTVDSPPADRRELAWRTGSAFPAVIALAAAVEPERAGWRRWWRQWSRDPAAFEDPHSLLTGGEIAGITGIEPGPELGKIVYALLRAQVRGEIRTLGGAKRWLVARCAGS